MDTSNSKDASQQEADLLLALPVLKKAAKIRRLLPQIEAALAGGVAHSAVLSQLNSAGFNLTPAYYKLILKRLRKEAKARAAAKSVKPRSAISTLTVSTQSHPDGPQRGVDDEDEKFKTVMTHRPPRNF